MPVQVDVFAPLPESWGMCSSCEMLLGQTGMGQAQASAAQDAYPPDWQDDFRRLSDLVFDLAQRFGEDISIRLYDPRSLPGMLKAIRHGVRRYPTFIVSGRAKITGWDLAKLEQHLMLAGAHHREETKAEAIDEWGS
jgi:hypothetical protein